ncbi:hypothetical protein [Herbiconiux flava]|uniref:Uncharacterized protein n=1 Tax=Herbiconiux flava TaxID=881268 RepID=A0A852SAG6_9MICO|nr:hypothetical protein [Herbiconiux flava]NYD69362.1 hypothetical protein [Herbiconiux flava]
MVGVAATSVPLATAAVEADVVPRLVYPASVPVTFTELRSGR